MNTKISRLNVLFLTVGIVLSLLLTTNHIRIAQANPAADWLGITSTNLDSHCGDFFPGGLYALADALDETDVWFHNAVQTHWFIIDLGATYTVSKVRGRSDDDYDPIAVSIFVSDSKDDWGDPVAEDISTWQDRTDWDGTAIIETTPKNGRYIKVEILGTEEGTPGLIMWGKSSSPYMTIFDVYGESTEAPPAAPAVHGQIIIVDED